MRKIFVVLLAIGCLWSGNVEAFCKKAGAQLSYKPLARSVFIRSKMSLSCCSRRVAEYNCKPAVLRSGGRFIVAYKCQYRCMQLNNAELQRSKNEAAESQKQVKMQQDSEYKMFKNQVIDLYKKVYLEGKCKSYKVDVGARVKILGRSLGLSFKMEGRACLTAMGMQYHIDRAQVKGSRPGWLSRIPGGKKAWKKGKDLARKIAKSAYSNMLKVRYGNVESMLPSQFRNQYKSTKGKLTKIEEKIGNAVLKQFSLASNKYSAQVRALAKKLVKQEPFRSSLRSAVSAWRPKVFANPTRFQYLPARASLQGAKHYKYAQMDMPVGGLPVSSSIAAPSSRACGLSSQAQSILVATMITGILNPYSAKDIIKDKAKYDGAINEKRSDQGSKQQVERSQKNAETSRDNSRLKSYATVVADAVKNALIIASAKVTLQCWAKPGASRCKCLDKAIPTATRDAIFDMVAGSAQGVIDIETLQPLSHRMAAAITAKLAAVTAGVGTAAYPIAYYISNTTLNAALSVVIAELFKADYDRLYAQHYSADINRWNRTMLGKSALSCKFGGASISSVHKAQAAVRPPPPLRKPNRPTQPPSTILTGVYRVLLTHGESRYLTQTGSDMNSGSNATAENWKGWNTQKWRFNHLGNNLYSIEIVHGGKRYLTQVGSTMNNGVNVAVERWKGWNTQKWRLNHLGGNQYSIEVGHGGKRYLTQVGTGYGNGSNVVVENWKGWNTQKWRLKR